MIEVLVTPRQKGVKIAKKIIPPKSGSHGRKWHFFGVKFWGGGMTGRAHFYDGETTSTQRHLVSGESRMKRIRQENQLPTMERITQRHLVS